MPILFLIPALIGEAKLLAARCGFEVDTDTDTDTKGPPNQRFDLFGLGHGKNERSGQCFLALRSAVTALPSAWPFDAFITAPTRAPIALPSPAQNFSHASG